MCNQKPFWKDLNPWDKWDKLKLPDHQRLLTGALHDPETGIEEVDRYTYILYGEEEALLLVTKIPVIKIALRLYRAITEIFHSGDFE